MARRRHRDDHETLFHSLVASLAELGATKYLPAIEQWDQDELINPYYNNIDQLRKTMLAPLEDRRASMHKPHYVRDAIAEMSWWACFSEPEEALRETGDLDYYDAPLTLPYVREHPKMGRNDPCPCGSGKKFKKCCGADD